MLRYESRHQPLISRRAFAQRMSIAILVAVLLTLGTMMIGAVEFRATEGMDWMAGALNSVLIITGNSPAHEPRTTAGTVFTMVFALLGVMVYISILAVLLAPVFHRLMHHFHLEMDPSDGEAAGRNGTGN